MSLAEGVGGEGLKAARGVGGARKGDRSPRSESPLCPEGFSRQDRGDPARSSAAGGGVGGGQLL